LSTFSIALPNNYAQLFMTCFTRVKVQVIFDPVGLSHALCLRHFVFSYFEISVP